MADQASQRTVVHASPDRVWNVLTDFAAYPEWAHDVKSATVVAHDEQGRGLEVAFRAAGMGRSTKYTLRYDYGDAPHVLSWKQVSGDATRVVDGRYTLAPVDGKPDQTDVSYHLTVDLALPLPAFVKRRAEGRVLRTALQELRDRVEDGSGKV